MLLVPNRLVILVEVPHYKMVSTSRQSIKARHVDTNTLKLFFSLPPSE